MLQSHNAKYFEYTTLKLCFHHLFISTGQVKYQNVKTDVELLENDYLYLESELVNKNTQKA